MYKDFIVASYEIGNSSLCAQDYQNLKNWVADTDMLYKPDMIASEGYEEFLRFGRRIKDTFPELLKDLQEKDYLFIPMFGDRMVDSSKAFVEGLNDSNLAVQYDRKFYRIIAVS